MSNSQLQVENGNFTRIVNPLIEELIRMPFRGCELQVALFIIRKTYGHQKTQDQISLTQMEKALGRGRPTIVKALANLQLVNIVKLVAKGSSKISSNIWAINKYSDTWKLVNLGKLVKRNNSTSLHVYTKTSKHVLTHKRKKENTKEIVAKDPNGLLQGKEWNEFIDLFEPINPNYEEFYKNKTERSAMEYLVINFGREKMLGLLKALPDIVSQKYAPRITKPTELKRDLGKLIIFTKQEKTLKKDDQKVYKV